MNDTEERLETLENLMREHTHSVIDGTSRLDDGKTIIQSVTNAATITPREKDDCIDITAIAQAFTIANPLGNAHNFDKLLIRVKDNGTARAITWGSAYAAGANPLPTTTVLSKVLVMGFMYETGSSVWRLVGIDQEA